MRAVRLTETGPPGVLSVSELPTPRPGPHEVLVRVVVAGINRRDLHLRSGKEAARLPFVIGSDGAGIVQARGAAVSGARPGDEVVIYPVLNWTESVPPAPLQILGGPTDGTCAEFLVVPAANVFPRPRCLSWAESASLSVTALAAWRGLVTLGRLQAGERVLIRDVGSGMTSFALVLAVGLGAEVFVTAGSAARLQKALTLGAAGAAVDTERRRYDLVADATGRWDEALRALRPGGRLIAFGGPAAEVRGVVPKEITQNGLSVLGTAMGSPSDFGALLEHVQQGTTRPVIDASLSLEQIADAHQHLEAREHFGKVVLVVSRT